MVTNLPKNSATPTILNRINGRVLWDDTVVAWDSSDYDWNGNAIVSNLTKNSVTPTNLTKHAA